MPRNKELDKDLLNTFEKMTDMFNNIVGTQRETLKLIATLGKMLDTTNKQVDLLTKLVLNQNKIHLK